MATKIIDGSTPSSTTALSDMVRDRIATDGGISSADIAEASSAAAKQEPGSGMRESTVVADTGSPDPLVLGANSAPATASTISDVANAISDMPESNLVNISMADKQAFVNALVRNDRLELEFSRLGGRVDCRVRSRTVAETKALLSYQREVLNRSPTITQLEYSTLLRACLVAAQVVSLNSDVFPVLEHPLMRETRVNTESKSSETVAQGWMPRIQYWMDADEARFNVAWSCVHEFETKYWNLVSRANDQDFWSTAASS